MDEIFFKTQHCHLPTCPKNTKLAFSSLLSKRSSEELNSMPRSLLIIVPRALLSRNTVFYTIILVYNHFGMIFNQLQSQLNVTWIYG